ncbi:hypothetical protein Taro_054119 [Colocasia esculenta]|uniref:tryptophan synthase n=1 Tax=Colocasia esculenta TaxID=4460 RepID=A0A843XQ85_COLES|nr:hypothetical protein [Colocasia esculenta]
MAVQASMGVWDYSAHLRPSTRRSPAAKTTTTTTLAVHHLIGTPLAVLRQPPPPPLPAAPSSGHLSSRGLSISETFANLKEQGKVAFIPYITAGDPDLSTTAEALRILDACGSKIIELGVPCSNPLADGPVIQAAAARALAKGTNIDNIFSMLKEVFFSPTLKDSENKCVLISKSITSSPKRIFLKDKISNMETVSLGRHT